MISKFSKRSTQFAIERAGLISRSLLAITLLLVVAAGLPSLFPDSLGFMPMVKIDTDPESMLPADDPQRVFHNEAKEIFQLHDAVVVGIVNEKNPNGVFNPKTLEKVYKLTEFAKGLNGVIVGDLMAPSTTDSIENAGPGTVRFEWLMAEPPETQEQALAIRDRAMRIPFLKNTLISEDGRALVIYIPLTHKDQAHEISTALSEEIARLGRGDDQFHIAGLPVAEDTFGIEMFIQMAISAPMAMLVIFVLMWFYFRNLVIITSPMLVAMASALITMAILVLTGNTIHIMSSMIPIFIMPIAVLDAVHIISDFFDSYPQIGDRRKTIENVMNHLFSPMLFTSLTTAAGFASLALTPIPPVQVFGIFIALGVLVAWICTIIFIPAYLMLLNPKRLEGFGRKVKEEQANGGVLAWIGRMKPLQAKMVLVVALGLVGVAVVGISRINVNDNPTKWFEEEHEIRIADRVLNSHFGGTYDAYLLLQPKESEYAASQLHAELGKAAVAQSKVTGDVYAELAEEIKKHKGEPIFDALDALDSIARKNKRKDIAARRRVAWSYSEDFLSAEFERAEEAEEALEEDSTPISPVVENAQAPSAAGEALPEAETQIVGPEMLQRLQANRKELQDTYKKVDALSQTILDRNPTSRKQYFEKMAALVADDGNAVLETFVDRESLSKHLFKQPQMLKYIEDLQAELATYDAVGKSNSLADIVKVVHRDLMSGEAKDYRIPMTSEVVAQTLAQYQSSHRKDDLWHFVTTDYDKSVVWLQLKTGDNMDMQRVVASVKAYMETHPGPVELVEPKWFGLTYINVVWQENMVSGMVNALLGSFVIVLIMMVLLFRSVLWGLLSMIPLTLTVGLIYGVLGLVGKDYDMPVAVLSSLSLGLAVDYAIHFLARSRELRMNHHNWQEAQEAVFQEPARAIARNVVIVGLGFIPLLLAPLVPYQTVGLLIASILIAAGLATLVLLPAMIQIFQRFLFGSK